MRALRAHQRGGPEQLVLEYAETPATGPGEVLVAVHAAAITLTELTWDLSWQTRDGADRTPVIPSHEVSGVVVQHGEDATVTGFLPGPTSNTFAGSTVNSIVIRIPHDDRALFPDRMISVWSATRLATVAGGRCRAGLPMIWPVFRDADSETASQANKTHPADDAVNYGKTIRDLVSATIRRLGTTARPDAYAYAVARRLLPDALPYQVGTPAVVPA